MQLQKSCHLKCFLLLWTILGHRKYPNTNKNVNTHFLISIDASLIITGGTLSIQDGSSIYNLICGAFFEFSWNFRKGHRFFIGVFRKLSNKFEPDILEQLLQDVRLFCFSEGRKKNGTVIKKGTGIAAPCCKKRITPERRRYATPPKETERKVCSRSELCIGCPFPASGFICWGSGEDCLRSRYMKLQNREESK